MTSNPGIIDLSYPLSDTMLVFPATERPTFSWKGRINSEGCNLTRMTMLVHTGTHADSPMHFIAAGLPIEQVPLERFYGETILFKVKNGATGKEFNPDDIEPSPDHLEEGGIFVINTGIGPYAETDDYNQLYNWPSKETVELLVRKKIRCYMTDATSVDPVTTKDSGMHKILFAAGIPIVENLANLDRITTGARFIISAFPLKLAGREGAPCRAVAFIE